VIIVIAVIEVSEGKQSEFLDVFRKLVPLVRAETGCIEYGPAVDATTDLSVQTLVGGNCVVVAEKWESLEALKAHLTVPHMGEFRANVKQIVTDTKIYVLDPQ
jgi:quinol monooxygenase YgiN